MLYTSLRLNVFLKILIYVASISITVCIWYGAYLLWSESPLAAVAVLVLGLTANTIAWRGTANNTAARITMIKKIKKLGF